MSLLSRVSISELGVGFVQSGRRHLAYVAVLGGLLVVGVSPNAFGQTATVSQPDTGTSATKPAVAASSKDGKAGTSRAKRRAKKAVAAEPASEALAPTAPVDVAPPQPKWPVNEQAEPAAVGWNGKDLSINATNSSLSQILKDVSSATGVKVEGMGSDQRIFGRYGPADARDVLAQLLDGSGYNVLIIGDKGEGTPRQIVLTTKARTAKTPGVQNGQPNPNGEDDAAEEPEQPEPQPEPPPPPQRPGGNPNQPGQGPRTPQQMMEELQQRQQQQQQQGNPGTPEPK